MTGLADLDGADDIDVPVGAIGSFCDRAGRTFVGLKAAAGEIREVIAGDFPITLDAGSTLPLLANWIDVVPRLTEVAGSVGPRHKLEELEVRSPVQPRQIIQSGANYRQHVIELAMAQREPDDTRDEDIARQEIADIMDRRARDGAPYLFVGLPSSIGAPYEALNLPDYSDRHDWELELAAVIGVEAHGVTPDEALSHVAGYTVCNDVTTRDRVFRRDMPAMGTDWFQGKSATGFLPTGPFLVAAHEITDPQHLQITLSVNGEIKQDASTSDMLFGVAELVAAASEVATLWPGDLILTGSPSGNGVSHGQFLRSGDVMVGGIEFLGTQRVTCVATPQLSEKSPSKEEAQQ